MEYNESDIAVCGYSCRFPLAATLEEFKNNIFSGRNCISYDKPEVCKKDFVYAYGKMSDIQKFDNEFFNISEREAEMMDPQQRWLITLCYEAMENSGHRIGDNNFIGIFAGASDFFSVWKKIFNSGNTSEMERFMHMRYLDGMLTSWVSYVLDLTGPSVPVKEACASSLAAVHLAVNSLLNYECDFALAGGINISCEQEGYIKAENTMSPSGIGRSFDKSADGFVPGNGGGILVLRRLEDSIRDKDTIHAVIKGSALNNDGKKTSGYSMPSIKGQTQVMKDALVTAGVSPHDVSYIETHGTATKLGDIIESESIKKAYKTAERKNTQLHIGAVKNNVGHLNYSAGAAGIIKTILMLENKKISPVANFEEENEELKLSRSKIIVDRKLTEWSGTDGKRFAGVSSFGVGGQNCHVILSDYVERNEGQESSGGYYIIPVSAKSKKSLFKYYNKMYKELNEKSNVGIQDISFTMINGRESYTYRSFIVSDSMNGILKKLKRKPNSRKCTETFNNDIILLFQGSSVVPWNEVKRIMGFHRVFRESFFECFGILKEISGCDLREYLDKDSIPNEMEYMMIFILSYANRKWLEYLGIEFTAVIGYSAGEYMAAEAAGVITLKDAMYICYHRNRLFAQIDEGTMIVAAVNCEDSEKFCIGSAEISGHNTDDRTVISGCTEDMKAVMGKLSDAGKDYFAIPVSRPGHCSLVEPVLKDMEQVFRCVEFKPPKYRYFSSSMGREVTDELTDPMYWVDQTRHPVLYSEAVKAAGVMKGAVGIDMGMKEQLSAMFRRNIDIESEQFAVAVIPDHYGIAEADILEGAGILWQSGININLGKIYCKGKRVPLPTYAFDEHDFTDNNREHEYQKTAESETVNIFSSGDTIEERAVKILNELIGLKLTPDDLERSIYDFSIDSMTALMVCSRFQKEFEITFSMRNFMVSSTLTDVIDKIKEATKNKTAGTADD